MTQSGRKQSRIPEFSTREEEARFWDSHDFTEFADEVTPVNVRFARNLSQGLTIRLDPPTLEKLRTVARARGLGPTQLARMWIMEHLSEAS